MTPYSEFRLPTEREVSLLANDSDAQEAYIDVLMYLHDLLCERSAEQNHSVFEFAEIVEGLDTCKGLLAKFKPALLPIVEQNISSTMKMREGIEERHGKDFAEDKRISSFLEVLVRAYQNLLELPSQGITNLAEVLERVLRAREPDFRAAGINIRKRIQTEGIVYGDMGDFEQLVSNLFQNISEVIPSGATLKIELFTSRERGQSGRHGSQLVIAASSSLGKERIFEPFYSTKRGTGLGLALAADIVEKHGGVFRVLAESKRKETGRAVKVFLPGPQLSSESPASAV
jgi:hypothetical protein